MTAALDSDEIRQLLRDDSAGSLRDRVYRTVRHMILSGGLPNGARVSESELAASLEVSRTPLREALRQLLAEGLIEQEQNRSLVVRGFGVRDLLEIFEIRESLDATAARKAAERIEDRELKLLQESIELAEFLIPRERWEDVRREFRRFHELVQAASGNHRLQELLTSLYSYSHHSSLLRRPTQQNAPLTQRDHVKLYEALAAHDGAAAARCAQEHILQEREQLLRLSAAEGSPGE
jgi:DNA-binding GntR family transcriptional regulator